MKIPIKTSDKIPVFSNSCFWDQDYTKLDFEKSKNYIIERVVSRGGSNDEFELFRYYGYDVIKDEVVKIRYLNRKILNYLSILFKILPNEFCCYNNKDIF
jgi:hypothetical protein